MNRSGRFEIFNSSTASSAVANVFVIMFAFIRYIEIRFDISVTSSTIKIRGLLFITDTFPCNVDLLCKYNRAI